jgi:hypothetical protein
MKLKILKLKFKIMKTFKTILLVTIATVFLIHNAFSQEKIKMCTNNYCHSDMIEIDNNGHFTCRFLEKKRPSVWAWGWKYMSFYTIFCGGFDSYRVSFTADEIKNAAQNATKENPKIIHIDTVWTTF